MKRVDSACLAIESEERIERRGWTGVTGCEVCERERECETLEDEKRVCSK